MNENEKIKEISQVYDDLAEEIRGVKRYSLPNVDNLTSGKNYKSFKKLHDFLKGFALLDRDNVRLYIKTQYAMLWTWHKFTNKVIPVNMMYNHNSMNRFIEFVKTKEEKVGKSRLENYLDKYAYAPLVEDPNCLSLTTDLRLVLQQLQAVYRVTNNVIVDDLLDIINRIETGEILSPNKHSICAAFIYLNDNLTLDDMMANDLYKKKLTVLTKTIKSRGKTYIDKLESKKANIIKTLARTTPEPHKFLLDFI